MPEFSCATCGTKLKAADTQVGKFVRCPRCKTTMRVPAAGGVATPETAPSRILPPSLSGIAAGTGGRRYGFNCQYCSSRLEATGAMAGQEGNCPTCGNTIVIPILDRYGRLIDPMTGKVIKQDPHPVHAYAAAGERAPRLFRGEGNKQFIGCPRCGTTNAVSANNCKNCGMPFTMEGTTLEAAGSANGFATAALVLGIIGLPTGCTVVVPVLAIIFGVIALNQIGAANSEGGGKGLAIAGIVCAGIGLLVAAAFWFN